MVYSYAAFLFILGMLGAANLIIAKKPDAADIIAKFSPYQGWMGVAGVFYGVYEIIFALGFTEMLGMGLFPMLLWITYVAAGGLQILLGFLLGVGTAKSFIKSPQAVEKMTQLQAKLAPFQGTLGLIAMATAVWYVVVIILA